MSSHMLNKQPRFPKFATIYSHSLQGYFDFDFDYLKKRTEFWNNFDIFVSSQWGAEK